MISQTPVVRLDKRMTALAVIDARYDSRPDDAAFLIKEFFLDQLRSGASSREAALLLMSGMADSLAMLIDMVDEDDPHKVVDSLRQQLLEGEL